MRVFLISRDKDSIRLACRECGAHRKLDGETYALAGDRLVECRVCGDVSPVPRPGRTPLTSFARPALQLFHRPDTLK
jgi:hypothetical protein